MRHPDIRPILALIPILLLSNAWAAGPIDPARCTATTRATQPVSIVCAPEGGGARLDRVYAYGGAIVDATIEIWVRDTDGEPVAFVPAEDLYLAGPGLGFCRFFNSADSMTNRDGYTYMQRALQAYGAMAEPQLGVYYAGDLLGGNVLPYVRVNSPDLSANGKVDLADVGRFSAIYHGQYDYAADFVWDGIVNLADVSQLAIQMGRHCWY